MRTIKLTQGKVAMVDDNSPSWIFEQKWYSANGYAARFRNRRVEFLHHVILKPKPGFYIDHINGNRLDNRSANLRQCTPSQNSLNRSRPNTNSRTGIIGVCYDRFGDRYIAHMTYKGKNMRIYCKTKTAAVRARANMERNYA
jgi:hypothetical protein